MQTRIYHPSPALRPFITHYRFWTNKKEESALRLKDFPRTAMDMLFFFEGKIALSIGENPLDYLDDCSFVGHFDQAYHILPIGSVQVMNIRFRPNGIYPLTKIPLHLMLNQHLDLSDLMGKQMLNLHEKLGEKAQEKARIEIFEQFLICCYQKNDLHHRLDYGIKKIQDCKGLISVKTLAESLNTNYKSLDRWFSKKVGLSPKRFIQLTRFKSILAEIEQQQTMDWMQIVADYNFYDQAHFVKEFKQFAGMPPSTFLKETQSAISYGSVA